MTSAAPPLAVRRPPDPPPRPAPDRRSVLGLGLGAGGSLLLSACGGVATTGAGGGGETPRWGSRGELHDRALWTATAAATGAAGNSTALVGTPETVAKALLDYVDIGVTTLLIRGYDPLDDAVGYGRELLPLVRQEPAHRAGGSAA